MQLPLLRFRQLESTQTYLREHPELGFCGVLAEEQTAGRGRWGNTWESPVGGGFHFSAALPAPALPPGILLQRAMLHAAALLDPAGTTLGLKWPNDLVAWRGAGLVKAGGILGEVQGERLILGLGVNFTSAPDLPERAVPPASLLDLGMAAPEAGAFAGTLLACWQDLTAAREPAFRWPLQGDAVRWEDGGQGVVLGWEEDGRLRLANASGVQRLAAGELAGLRPPA